MSFAGEVPSATQGKRFRSTGYEEVLMARRFLIAVAVMALGAVFIAPQAQGAFGIANWESVTCEVNADTPALGGKVIGLPPLEQSPGQCTKSTPEKWSAQGGIHPQGGIPDFTVNSLRGPGAEGFPDGFVKDIVVET